MPDYTFRVRFFRSPTDTVNIESPRWEWHLPQLSKTLVLCSAKEDEPVKDSKRLVFKSSGWPSLADAQAAASKYSDALALSLARVQVGTDFGPPTPESVATAAGLAKLEAQTGQRCLNDVHGAMAYESEPTPRFVSVSLSLLKGIPQERFERVFSFAADHPRDLSPHERLSLRLFHTSFFESTVESRFLMLVMSIEALLIPATRQPAALAHVDELIEATRASNSLAEPEKQSLLGSLKWLRVESISKTGRRLAAERLAPRTYGGMTPSNFFAHCYDLRSRLVHGGLPSVAHHGISAVFPELQKFVSDLVSGDLLQVQL